MDLRDFRVVNSKIINHEQCVLYRHKSDKDKFAIRFADEVSIYDRQKALAIWKKL